MSSNRDVEVGDTLPREPTVGAMPPATGPPVAHWERYELLEPLGKGGMGTVYLARDPRLDRMVAIKFILGVDPNLMLRFLREARAQARIDHPNVCRVYEVGEIEGHGYIALQLVDGVPLHEAIARMTLDQQIAAVRDVALAVDNAHRLGIVHRDLKPANVLVERTNDGRWVPIVMDFGLAREASVDVGITESGALLGTPAYMSPEQARGDVRAVDRRTDIYSLGATLYELLVGRPPFVDASLALTLAQILHEDPPAPRSLVPSLPVDLETIALKCLAKDPALRYASARALADDLGRYLDGEPILGRRLSLWQRARLRARRHRAVVRVGASALAIIVALAALGLRAWISARAERALAADHTRLAQRLGQDAKEIELSLHAAYQLPLHDTRPDRDRIRTRMRSISETRHDLGALGDAVVHEALGRGHLALHEWREAAAELASATAGGLVNPALHTARGRALSELYRRAVDDARRSGDRAWLLGRQQELSRQYLTPALAELELGRGSDDSAAMLGALIALDRRDFASAQHRADELSERAPWSSEARKLAGDAAHGAAMARFDHGDYDAARPGLERATALYAEASEIARSDAAIYEAAAQAWLERAELDFRQGRSPSEPLEHALDVIDRALRADPDSAPAYTIKAYVLLRWFQTPSLRGLGDQRPLLERIADTAEHAVALDPLDAGAWDGLGNAHVYRGIYEAPRGGQAGPWWNRALDEIGRALAIQPDDPWANNDLAVAHRWLGASLDEAGLDPMPEYQAALRGYERAVMLDPQFVFACSNQADLQESIAEHDAANERDPRPAVERTRSAGERCLAIDPSYYGVLDTMAQAQLVLVRHLVDTGGDPAVALATARSDLDRAEALHPGNMVTWFYRLSAAGAEAKFRIREGADPTSSFAVGHRALAEALRLAPDSAICYVEAARLALVEAEWATRAGTGSVALLASALAAAEKAIALNERSAEARLAAAQACLQIAMAKPSHATFGRGIAHIDQALALNPRLPGAKAVRTQLLRLSAPWSHGPGWAGASSR